MCVSRPCFYVKPHASRRCSGTWLFHVSASSDSSARQSTSAPTRASTACGQKNECGTRRAAFPEGGAASRPFVSASSFMSMLGGKPCGPDVSTGLKNPRSSGSKEKRARAELLPPIDGAPLRSATRGSSSSFGNGGRAGSQDARRSRFGKGSGARIRAACAASAAA